MSLIADYDSAYVLHSAILSGMQVVSPETLTSFTSIGSGMLQDTPTSAHSHLGRTQVLSNVRCVLLLQGRLAEQAPQFLMQWA